jgi:signal transduction histidine kinase
MAVLMQQKRHMATVRSFSDRLLTAHEEERALVARELHDDVLQRVAVLVGELDDRQKTPPDSWEAYARWVGEFREEVADLAEDVRSIAKRMHPAVLDHLGLEAALKVMAEEMSKTDGVQVEMNLDLRHKSSSLPRELTTSLYRIAQEALRNVAQHAQVDRAALSILECDGGIQLVVEDQGRGLPDGWKDSVAGLGITSMQERVRLIDGRLTVAPSAQGTRVEAWVPLRRPS